jgi:hypothetical protein
MRKSNLSFAQRVHNAYGSQEVENVRALHAFGHARNLSTREWGQIWATCPDTAWAHSFGRNRGFEDIWRICVGNYDVKGCINYLKLYDVDSDALGFDMRAMMMVAMHTLSSECIEVADDGKTARAWHLTPGPCFNHMQPKMPGEPPRPVSASGGYERYGSDYVFEDGRWKLLHEHISPDLHGPFWHGDFFYQGFYEKYSGQERPPMGPPPGGSKYDAIVPDGFPEMSELQDNHYDYSALQPVQPSCRPPKPYKTFDGENTYAPILDPEYFAAL